MRALVDVLHPKQAHFWRPLVARWRARGDAVLVTTRDKDITHRLREAFRGRSALRAGLLSADRGGGGGGGRAPAEPYAVVRLVRWAAAHDVAEAGFTREHAMELVAGLARRMRVLLTSEAEPPPEIRE